MNNILFIDGGSHADVKKALRQWIDTYSSELEPNSVFKIYKNGNGQHVIQADEDLDNDLFFFLVNYMQYPVGIYYKATVKGYTSGTERNVLKDKQVLVFIPETDTEYDNVYIVTEANESYKVEFSKKIIASSEIRLYEREIFRPIGKPEILRIERKHLNEVSVKEETSIENRLKWLVGIVIALNVFNFLIVKPFSIDQTISFGNVPFFISFGISLWLFFDYKLLQTNTRYLKCLCLAGGTLIYIFLLAKFELLHLSKVRTAITIFPLMLLIVQWPLRYVFLQALSQEPVVDNHPRKFTTGFYTMLLLVIPVAITLILSGMI